MDYYSSQITKLIEELSKLPGIGNKSAQRLAFHIINMPEEQVERLSSAITSAKKNVRYCRECFTLTDKELCPICESQKREITVSLWWWKTREIWPLTRKRENTTAFTTSCTERFLPCLALGREISG